MHTIGSEKPGDRENEREREREKRERRIDTNWPVLGTHVGRKEGGKPDAFA
jgi:hypothetical protein